MAKFNKGFFYRKGKKNTKALGIQIETMEL